MITLNRALDQAFTNGRRAQTRVWVPAIDVVEKKDAYLLYAELPGVDASQVDISFEQNVLTIRGTKQSAIDATNEGELRVYAAERVTGNFERSVRLPEFVDGRRSAPSSATACSRSRFRRHRPPSAEDRDQGAPVSNN